MQCSGRSRPLGRESQLSRTYIGSAHPGSVGSSSTSLRREPSIASIAMLLLAPGQQELRRHVAEVCSGTGESEVANHIARRGVVRTIVPAARRMAFLAAKSGLNPPERPIEGRGGRLHASNPLHWDCAPWQLGGERERDQ